MIDLIPDDAEGVVYFVQARSGPVKIGWTRDIDVRFSQLQVGNHEQLTLLRIIPARAALERELHRAFDAYRCRGEWFWPAPPLMQMIAGDDIAAAMQAVWSDGIDAWLRERCCIGQDKRERTMDLFEDYLAFSGRNAGAVSPLGGVRHFGRELDGRGFDSLKSGGVMWRIGLALQPLAGAGRNAGRIGDFGADLVPFAGCVDRASGGN